LKTEYPIDKNSDKMDLKRFLLIDDHEAIRSGVRHLLMELFNPCDIYEAADEKSALQQLKERSYQLMILDVQIPEMNAFGLMEYIKITYPDARVLIFSMSAEKVYARKFLKAGAKGYISKTSGFVELRKAIELILDGRKYISDSLAEHLAIDFEKGKGGNPFEKLSSREFEIASLLIAGVTVTKISERLSINTSTVGTHKARIFEKLGVKNLLELVEMAKLYEFH
jgi:two-component system invasion response regulator UvrY